MRVRERSSLTLRGWSILIVILLALAALILFNLNFFLAPEEPVRTDVLVVEGWLPDFAYAQVVNEFHSHPYRTIITTGGPLEKGFYLEQYKTEAGLSAATLLAVGIGKDSVLAVPSPFTLKDRTFGSAISLRKWIDSTHAPVHSFNILTLGAHGRRTRLLFEKAFGGGVKIGIISARDLTYDQNRWWASSEGVRKVVDESVAYLYARFLFFR